MRAAVVLEDLVHDFGGGPVLEIDALRLDGGRVHLAGPNGAGKTTLLRILATLVTPTRGSVHVAGHDAATDGRAVRRNVGFAGHQTSLHDPLTVRSALMLHAHLFERPQAVDPALERWGLLHAAERPVGALSHGQRRRADLARALLHRPPVVLLDEPATGLDAEALEVLDAQLDAIDPRLVLVAAPEDPGLPVDERLHLEDGHTRGEAP